ncbi:MAG: Holliday junction ATP-dependent DNA helicase RuvA [Armatimonadota bacterium]|nr:MAG: Holliday junction ATP-dependent DNA helicase RuvA [Armatimonadota bacterium]
MIAYLKGNVLRVGASHCVLEVGGVGYRVQAPAPALAAMREGETAALFIYTSVREDAIELYGFSSELEQQLFETLISVSGVGPRMAMGMLSAMSVRDIASAARDDGARLQTIPGIGRKTAQRIALEVGEKLQELAIAAAAEQPTEPDAMADVLEGLVALGYSRSDARRAAQEARKKFPQETSAAVLLKEALNVLNR